MPSPAEIDALAKLVRESKSASDFAQRYASHAAHPTERTWTARRALANRALRAILLLSRLLLHPTFTEQIAEAPGNNAADDFCWWRRHIDGDKPDGLLQALAHDTSVQRVILVGLDPGGGGNALVSVARTTFLPNTMLRHWTGSALPRTNMDSNAAGIPLMVDNPWRDEADASPTLESAIQDQPPDIQPRLRAAVAANVLKVASSWAALVVAHARHRQDSNRARKRHAYAERALVAQVAPAWLESTKKVREEVTAFAGLASRSREARAQNKKKIDEATAWLTQDALEHLASANEVPRASVRAHLPRHTIGMSRGQWHRTDDAPAAACTPADIMASRAVLSTAWKAIYRSDERRAAQDPNGHIPWTAVGARRRDEARGNRQRVLHHARRFVRSLVAAHCDPRMDSADLEGVRVVVLAGNWSGSGSPMRGAIPAMAPRTLRCLLAQVEGVKVRRVDEFRTSARHPLAPAIEMEDAAPGAPARNVKLATTRKLRKAR